MYIDKMIRQLNFPLFSDIMDYITDITFHLVFCEITGQIYYEFRADVLYNIKDTITKKIMTEELYNEKSS